MDINFDNSVEFDASERLVTEEIFPVAQSVLDAMVSIASSFEVIYESTRMAVSVLREVVEALIIWLNEFLHYQTKVLISLTSRELPFPSFNDPYDVTVPHTGPPAISDDLRDEKEFFGKIALAIFAYSLVVIVVCVGFTYPTEISTILSAIESSNPILFKIGSPVIGIILEKKLKKYKDKIISIFWPF